MVRGFFVSKPHHSPCYGMWKGTRSGRCQLFGEAPIAGLALRSLACAFSKFANTLFPGAATAELKIMAAPKGNKFWEARSSHGANPKFAEPTDLWDACLEYFEWVERNPLKEQKIVSSGGKAIVKSMSKMRAMSIGGLCIFLDVTEQTWRQWRSDRQDLSSVITRVEQIIRTQKFEGASADLLNPNIIARDLGLAERTKLAGDPDNPLVHEVRRTIVRS